MNLATVALYRDLIGNEKPNISAVHTKAIEARIRSVSAKVEKYLGRGIESMAREESFPASNGSGTKSVRLYAFPAESIDSLKIWGSSQTEGNFFEVSKDEGIVSFYVPVTRDKELYQNAIKIEYTGGMASSTDDFILKYPEIATEVCMQVYFEISRQTNIAEKSTSMGAGISTSLNAYQMQSALLEVLRDYVRPAGLT